jgi:hypothetical protein
VALAGEREPLELALDPGSQLGERVVGGAQRRPRRQQHLDAVVGVDADLHAPRALHAPDAMGDLVWHARGA